MGLNLTIHGTARIRRRPACLRRIPGEHLSHDALPARSVMIFGLSMPWVEAATGQLLLLGLLTRATLIASFLTLLALTFDTTLRQDWEIAGTQLIYAVIYAALCLPARERLLPGWIAPPLTLASVRNPRLPSSGARMVLHGFFANTSRCKLQRSCR